MAGKSLFTEFMFHYKDIYPAEWETVTVPNWAIALCRVLERRLDAMHAQRVAEFELTRRPVTVVEHASPPSLHPGDVIRTERGTFMVESPLSEEKGLWFVRRTSDMFRTVIAEDLAVEVYRLGQLLWSKEGK